MQNKLANYLALWRTPGVGPVTFKMLCKTYPKVDDLPPKFAKLKAKLTSPAWRQVEHDLRWAEGADCHIITFDDAAYPKLLKQIHDAPPLLFVKGNIASLAKPQLAIVGARGASCHGKVVTKRLATELAERGLVITSGLARGIDTVAHTAAIAVGSSIAVVAGGIDCIYPAMNVNLANRIMEKGAVVAEYPLGVKPLPQHFPRRNRIISGLSTGVLVTEANINSGSLITAQQALEQGREVFAVPGCIDNELSRGCHKLIRQGAKLVESVDDIVEELSALFGYALVAKEKKPELLAVEEQLLHCIDYRTTSLDQVIGQNNLPASVVTSTLLSLELAGCVKSVPGGYCRLL